MLSRAFLSQCIFALPFHILPYFHILSAICRALLRMCSLHVMKTLSVLLLVFNTAEVAHSCNHVGMSLHAEPLQAPIRMAPSQLRVAFYLARMAPIRIASSMYSHPGGLALLHIYLMVSAAAPRWQLLVMATVMARALVSFFLTMAPCHQLIPGVMEVEMEMEMTLESAGKAPSQNHIQG